MVNQIVTNVLEELETTVGQVGQQVKQAVKGAVTDAGKQISGNQQVFDTGTLSPWEQIVGKPTDPKQLQQEKQKEEIEKQKKLNRIRQNLTQMLEPPPSAKQEAPKYIKAKIEKQEKMQKELEEQKKKPPPLAQKVAQGMAGPETRGGWGVGG